MRRCLLLSIVVLALPACATKRWAKVTEAERKMVAAGYAKLHGLYDTGFNMTGVTLKLSKDGTYEATGWGCVPPPLVQETGEWNPDEKGIELRAHWQRKPEPFVAHAYTVTTTPRGLALIPRLPSHQQASPRRNSALWRIQE